MEKRINLLVVDDHHLFRCGIVALLNNFPQINVIGEATDGQAALDILSRRPVDLVVLDLEMPQMNGLETAIRINKIYSEVAILVLTNHTADSQIAPLMQVGVKGFLSKDCTKEELQTAIQVLSQGAGYFSSIISEILLRPKASNDRTSDKTFKKLTVREREVLECIANEYTNKEIAGRLFISQRTVETHRRNLIQKLKVKNTVGLVKYYFQAYGNLSNNKVGIST